MPSIGIPGSVSTAGRPRSGERHRGRAARFGPRAPCPRLESRSPSRGRDALGPGNNTGAARRASDRGHLALDWNPRGSVSRAGRPRSGERHRGRAVRFGPRAPCPRLESRGPFRGRDALGPGNGTGAVRRASDRGHLALDWNPRGPFRGRDALGPGLQWDGEKRLGPRAHALATALDGAPLPASPHNDRRLRRSLLLRADLLNWF